jgi:hypothetical protein
MWKAQLGRAIKEVRFVLKPATEHHGTWWVNTKYWRPSWHSVKLDFCFFTGILSPPNYLS